MPWYFVLIEHWTRYFVSGQRCYLLLTVVNFDYACADVLKTNCRYGNNFHMKYTHSISVVCHALVLSTFHLPSMNWSADPWTTSKLSVLKSCRKIARCTRTYVVEGRMCINSNCSFQIQEKDVTHTPESTAASKERRSWNQRTFPSCLTIPWQSQKKLKP